MTVLPEPDFGTEEHREWAWRALKASSDLNCPISDPEWDSSGLIRPSNRTGDRQSLRDIAAERKLPRTPHKSHKNAMLSVPRLHLHEPSAVRFEKAQRRSSSARSFGASEQLRFELTWKPRGFPKVYALSQRGRPLPDNRSRPDQDFVACFAVHGIISSVELESL